MTVAAGQPPAAGSTLASWEKLRAAEDIQFAPVDLPPQPPREPGALERFFRWLGDIVGDVLGGTIGGAWPVLKWVLLATAIAALLYALWRAIDPLSWRAKPASDEEETPEWRPDQNAARALLEDADRLAAEGRFDEATHLLLQRSVNHIASARPDWVPPSSTARELAGLPALPDAARTAFGEIALRVERSLFALRSLEQADWVAAREAYARFALERIEARPA